MPTVVIIHAAEDALPARALAEKIRQAKLDVALERTPGPDLRNAIDHASLCVALWSPRAVEQAALAEDVGYARQRGKVLHARMQNAEAPAVFRADDTVNLTGWRGEDDFGPWRDLAGLVTAAAGVAPLPPPEQRPPSGFFQPGRSPQAAAQGQGRAAPAAPRPQSAQPQPARQQPAAPAPRAAAPPRSAPAYDRAPPEEPKSGGGRGMMMGLIAFVVVALAAGGGYYFWNQSQGAQTVSAAWDDVPRNDAGALRAFLDGNPGAHRAEAQAALADLEERSFEAASDADTIAAFEAFLNDFPASDHALAVRGRIAELRTLEDQTAEEDALEEEGLAEDVFDEDALATPLGQEPDAATPDGSEPQPGDGPVTLTPAPEPQPAEDEPAPQGAPLN